MLDKLDQIEKHLQFWVEGSLTRLFPETSLHRLLVHQLVQAMQSNLVTSPQGVVKAPTQYIIHIHPSRSEVWQNYQPLLEDLANKLYQAATGVGITFSTHPSIHLSADSDLPVKEIRISTSMPHEKLGQTASISLNDIDFTPTIPPNAFFIINGDQNFMLKLPVINIGRRPDNHLVFTDPRVSRTHAQLRAIKGRYVLFDLGSTGGTMVNGKRVHQQALNPGDVISLAGVPLIYGQDMSGGLTSPDTADLNLSPGHQGHHDGKKGSRSNEK